MITRPPKTGIFLARYKINLSKSIFPFTPTNDKKLIFNSLFKLLSFTILNWDMSSSVKSNFNWIWPKLLCPMVFISDLMTSPNIINYFSISILTKINVRRSISKLELSVLVLFQVINNPKPFQEIKSRDLLILMKMYFLISTYLLKLIVKNYYLMFVLKGFGLRLWNGFVRSC